VVDIVVSVMPVIMKSTEGRQEMYNRAAACSTEPPQSVAKKSSRRQCALACSRQRHYREFNFDEMTNECSLYITKTLSHQDRPGCLRYQARHGFINIDKPQHVCHGAIGFSSAQMLFVERKTYPVFC